MSQTDMLISLVISNNDFISRRLQHVCLFAQEDEYVVWKESRLTFVKQDNVTVHLYKYCNVQSQPHRISYQDLTLSEFVKPLSRLQDETYSAVTYGPGHWNVCQG